MKPFEHWKYEELEITFGLKRLKTDPLLQQWEASNTTPNAYEQQTLDFLSEQLQSRADSWNEDELKFYFIGPLVSLVNFNGENYSGFNQRTLAFQLKDVNGEEVPMKGRVELMVAKGKQDPREPYFFLHEYKPEKRRDNDPLGQLMAAMLTAQAANKAVFPLKGCYVVGRFWFFVVLNGSKYSLSRAYDSAGKDLVTVFSMLKMAKDEVVQRMGQ
jgi:hypothetical protein